jgi:hypothetical protein
VAFANAPHWAFNPPTGNDFTIGQAMNKNLPRPAHFRRRVPCILNPNVSVDPGPSASRRLLDGMSPMEFILRFTLWVTRCLKRI